MTEEIVEGKAHNIIISGATLGKQEAESDSRVNNLLCRREITHCPSFPRRLPMPFTSKFTVKSSSLNPSECVVLDAI